MGATQLDADILVVDDELGIRLACQRALARLGARVKLAATGDEAIRQLTSRNFDVALIDLVMPNLSGMEVLARIAESEIDVVPIVITAHASLDTAIEAVKRGAFDYLPKPFVPLELTTRVERALRWQRLRQEAGRRLLELDTEKSRLRTIVKSLADGVIIANAEGQVVLCNPAACEALGLADGLREPRLLDQVVRDPRLLNMVRAVAADPQADEAASTTEFRTGDRIYMARAVPIEASEGEALGTATVLRDVTELMRLERAKLQFMSKVAHELKAPLAAIQGFLNLVLGEQELTPEKRRELLERSRGRVASMIQLVLDLLELSRADALPARKVEPLLVGEIVAEVAEASRSMAKGAEVSLEVDVPPDCPPVHADCDDLTRMVANLVNNAIKYNRPGGRTMVSARRDGDRLRIDVSDTGIGIPPEALPRLGEEFFRVLTPERKNIVGTGLGLSLVKRMLADCGGRLEVTSKVSEGSTFSLLLPLGPPR